jgi:short-subunit dehydrogenase
MQNTRLRVALVARRREQLEQLAGELSGAEILPADLALESDLARVEARIAAAGAGSPVRVQALCPAFTITGFHDAMGMSLEGIPAWLWMRAEDVVDASLRGLGRGRPLVVPGAIYKLVVALEKLAPRALRSVAVVRAPQRAKGA